MSSSDHSICIAKQLDEIKNPIDKIMTKNDIEQMVTTVMRTCTKE